MSTAVYAAWLARVAAAPHRYDFLQVLRHIESAHPQLPRLGTATRLAEEPVRIGQPAELTFAPASLSALENVGDPERPPRLMQRIFGLLGPNGALPIHMTEMVRERSHQHADAALQRFLDMLTHRFALLFYRAWAEAQPVLGGDRPGDRRFERRLGALFGIGEESLLGRDALGDAAKVYFTGRLARQVRDADGLLAWCKAQFDVPVRIEPWCGHWMTLDRDERTRIGGGDRQGLGRGAVAGGSTWDVQHKFRIVVGPLRIAQYRRFLPGGDRLAQLQAMVRHWVGLELAWDLRLVLARDDVPSMRVGATAGSVGRTAWLGSRPHAADAGDLILDVERVLGALARRRAAARSAAQSSPGGASESPLPT